MATKTKAQRAASMAANNARITAANTKAGATVARQAAADASALSSMNAVRTSQGLAPQAAIGEKAQGRTNGALSIDQTTNEIKDATGAVVGKGSSLSDALAKQTQLSSGAAPTVAGRPDLFAVAPGANQEVKPFLDPSTQTMVTPKVATPEQMAAQANGTLDSFNKSQGLTYLDGSTFKDLQPLLNETDLIRGPNGQIWLKQGLTPEQVRARAETAVAGTATGVDNLTQAETFNVDVPETISTDSIDELMSTPVTESEFNSMLGEIQVAQDKLLELMVPTDAEQALKAEVGDLKAQIEKTLVELSMGLNNVEDQPIAMQFITGQQASIQRSAEAKLQNLARLEENLLYELGLEQEARAVQASVAETKLGYLQTNLDTAFKVKQLLQQEEDSVFNRARALKQDAQTALSTILESMAGIDETDMTAAQQKQLQDMAIAADVPYSLLTAGLSNVKKQMMVDAASEGNELLSISDAASLGVPYGTTKAEAASLGLFVETGGGDTSQSNVTTSEGIFRNTYDGDGNVINSVKIGDSAESAEKVKQQAIAESGLTSLETMKEILKNDGGSGMDGTYLAPSLINSGTYEAARKNVADTIGRLRSGGAITQDELKTFLALLPDAFDSTKTVEDKINQVEEILTGYLGGSDEESTSSLTNEERQYIIDNGGDPDDPAFSNDLSTSQNGSPLEIAVDYVGLDASDPKQAKTLSAFFKKAGGVDIDPATTAWCAAFANSVLGAAGVTGTGSLMAQSFLKFGTTVSKPTTGDIVVFERGANGSGLGHVGFIVGVNDNGSLQVLGGNQDGSTNIQTFKTDRVLGYRRIDQNSVSGLS